jgi:hypothetical protein
MGVSRPLLFSTLLFLFLLPDFLLVVVRLRAPYQSPSLRPGTYTFRIFAVSQILGSLLLRFLPLPLVSPAGSFVHTYCMLSHTTYPPAPPRTRQSNVSEAVSGGSFFVAGFFLLGSSRVSVLSLVLRAVRPPAVDWLAFVDLAAHCVSWNAVCVCVCAALAAFLSLVSANPSLSPTREMTSQQCSLLRGAQALFIYTHLVLPFLVCTRCPFVVVLRTHSSTYASAPLPLCPSAALSATCRCYVYTLSTHYRLRLSPCVVLCFARSPSLSLALPMVLLSGLVVPSLFPPPPMHAPPSTVPTTLPHPSLRLLPL